jgi:hypothetical protein
LTTNKKYAIINISKEREVKDMRKISYEVNGVKVASYARARVFRKETRQEGGNGKLAKGRV